MNIILSRTPSTVLLCLFLCTHLQCRKPADNPPATIAPHVLRIFPHDSTAFTQGLFLHTGKLYESTGLYGQSRLRIIDTATGTLLHSEPIAKNIFGEGWTLHRNRIYQITWKKQHCFIYNPENLHCIDTVMYSGEGWGLTSNGKTLFMSNGTDTLYKRNSNFEIIGKLSVTLSGKPLANLNELEFARGLIYANVWFSDFIFEIDPKSGKVCRIIDCSSIIAEEKPLSDQAVLNGIAYNPDTDLFYLTGKNWKKMFVVRIEP